MRQDYLSGTQEWPASPSGLSLQEDRDTVFRLWDEFGDPDFPDLLEDEDVQPWLTPR